MAMVPPGVSTHTLHAAAPSAAAHQLEGSGGEEGDPARMRKEWIGCPGLGFK